MVSTVFFHVHPRVSTTPSVPRVLVRPCGRCWVVGVRRLVPRRAGGTTSQLCVVVVQVRRVRLADVMHGRRTGHRAVDGLSLLWLVAVVQQCPVEVWVQRQFVSDQALRTSNARLLLSVPVSWQLVVRWWLAAEIWRW